MAIVASSRFFFQLNDGEQLYASILPGNLRLDRLGELRLANSRSGLPVSHQIMSAYARVGEAARDRLVEAVARLVEAFDRALAGEERLVVVVDVGRDEVRRFGVGAREDDASARPCNRRQAARR